MEAAPTPSSRSGELGRFVIFVVAVGLVLFASYAFYGWKVYITSDRPNREASDLFAAIHLDKTTRSEVEKLVKEAEAFLAQPEDVAKAKRRFGAITGVGERVGIRRVYVFKSCALEVFYDDQGVVIYKSVWWP